MGEVLGLSCGPRAERWLRLARRPARAARVVRALKNRRQVGRDARADRRLGVARAERAVEYREAVDELAVAAGDEVWVTAVAVQAVLVGRQHLGVDRVRDA